MAVSNYTNKSRGTAPGASFTDRHFVPIAVGGLLVLALSAFALLSLRGAGGSTKPVPRTETQRKENFPTQTTRLETFAPTKAGAVAAATAFETRFVVLDLENEATARDWANAQAASAFSGGMADLLDKRLQDLDTDPFQQAKADGKKYFAKTWPITFRVRKFSPTRAVVTVWSTNISAIERTASPRVSWTTDTITVAREDNTWKIAGYRVDPPIVPLISGADRATSDEDFYAAQTGSAQYAVAP